jgi:hypothetical protein
VVVYETYILGQYDGGKMTLSSSCPRTSPCCPNRRYTHYCLWCKGSDHILPSRHTEIYCQYCYLLFWLDEGSWLVKNQRALPNFKPACFKQALAHLDHSSVNFVFRFAWSVNFMSVYVNYEVAWCVSGWSGTMFTRRRNAENRTADRFYSWMHPSISACS